jgi:hypothetical protein
MENEKKLTPAEIISDIEKWGKKATKPEPKPKQKPHSFVVFSHWNKEEPEPEPEPEMTPEQIIENLGKIGNS